MTGVGGGGTLESRWNAFGRADKMSRATERRALERQERSRARRKVGRDVVENKGRNNKTEYKGYIGRIQVISSEGKQQRKKRKKGPSSYTKGELRLEC
jgi:hypothetical protein